MLRLLLLPLLLLATAAPPGGTDRPRPRLIGLDVAAWRVNVHPRTLRRYIDKGWLTPYRVRGKRGLFLDVAEIENDLPQLARRSARPGLVAAFGPDSRPVQIVSAEQVTQ